MTNESAWRWPLPQAWRAINGNEKKRSFGTGSLPLTKIIHNLQFTILEPSMKQRTFYIGKSLLIGSGGNGK